MDDPNKMMEQCIVNVCQPGSDLRCAGYCLYSSSTIMVLTIGDGVYGFTLDPLIGEFVLTHPNIKVPEVRVCGAPVEGGPRPTHTATCRLIQA